jgi:hypothetical protein
VEEGKCGLFPAFVFSYHKKIKVASLDRESNQRPPKYHYTATLNNCNGLGRNVVWLLMTHSYQVSCNSVKWLQIKERNVEHIQTTVYDLGRVLIGISTRCVS